MYQYRNNLQFLSGPPIRQDIKCISPLEIAEQNSPKQTIDTLYAIGIDMQSDIKSLYHKYFFVIETSNWYKKDTRELMIYCCH
jgi:hypothetical protein